MSGTGSLLIRNLRDKGDYAKAVKAQDELLKIAIANDAKIARARKGYIAGEVPALTSEQEKDPAELQADVAKQEADLISNLQSLGFRYAEIQTIVGKIADPDTYFKINQTFPSIKRELEKSYNIKLITPTFFLDWLVKYLDRLDRASGFIPASSSETESQKSKFDIGGSSEAQQALIPEAEMTGGTPSKATKASPVYTNYEDFKKATLGNKKAFLTSRVKSYVDSLNNPSKELRNQIKNIRAVIKTATKSNEEDLDTIYLENQDVINYSIPEEVPPAKKEGEGLIMKPKGKGLRVVKIGKGILVEQQPSYRPLGKYLININQLENQDILNVKYPSLAGVPKFHPTAVSDIFKDFIIDLLDNGKPNTRIYDQLPPEERQMFEKIATGAGVFQTLKLKKTLTDQDKIDNDRFTLLKGEYLAGNNSNSLLKELRRLVIKFMNNGRLHKTEAINFLLELSI